MFRRRAGCCVLLKGYSGIYAEDERLLKSQYAQQMYEARLRFEQSQTYPGKIRAATPGFAQHGTAVRNDTHKGYWRPVVDDPEVPSSVPVRVRVKQDTYLGTGWNTTLAVIIVDANLSDTVGALVASIEGQNSSPFILWRSGSAAGGGDDSATAANFVLAYKGRVLRGSAVGSSGNQPTIDGDVNLGDALIEAIDEVAVSNVLGGSSSGSDAPAPPTNLAYLRQYIATHGLTLDVIEEGDAVVGTSLAEADSPFQTIRDGVVEEPSAAMTERWPYDATKYAHHEPSLERRPAAHPRNPDGTMVDLGQFPPQS